MSFAYSIPDGHLLPAIIFTGIAVSLLVIVYAALIAAIPRAGGDYTWQSRILGGGRISFVLAMTGWWFILWHWTPIYANILVVQFIAPLLATIGQQSAATWSGTPTGIFLSCLLTLAVVGIVVTLGMEAYARIQKVCFYGGLAALAVLCALLFASTQSDFHTAFNREAASLFGASGDPYQQTILYRYTLIRQFETAQDVYPELTISVSERPCMGARGASRRACDTPPIVLYCFLYDLLRVLIEIPDRPWARRRSAPC